MIKGTFTAVAGDVACSKAARCKCGTVVHYRLSDGMKYCPACRWEHLSTADVEPHLG